MGHNETSRVLVLHRANVRACNELLHYNQSYSSVALATGVSQWNSYLIFRQTFDVPVKDTAWITSVRKPFGKVEVVRIIGVPGELYRDRSRLSYSRCEGAMAVPHQQYDNDLGNWAI
jgi:hypothetical protein